MRKFLYGLIIILWISIFAFTSNAQDPENDGKFEIGVKTSYLEFIEKDNELKFYIDGNLFFVSDEIELEDNNTMSLDFTQYYRINNLINIGLEESYIFMNKNKNYEFEEIDLGIEVDKMIQIELNLKLDLYKNDNFEFVIGGGVCNNYVKLDYYRTHDSKWLSGYQGFINLGYENPEGIYAQLGCKYQVIEPYEITERVEYHGLEFESEIEFDYTNIQFEFEIGIRTNIL